MATQLELVNRVLLRLREDQVATVVENDYSTLIAEFIRAGIEDVVSAHDWERYIRTTFAELIGSAPYSTANMGLLTGASGSVLNGTVMTHNSKLTWLGHDTPTLLFTDTDYPTSLLQSTTVWVPLTPITHDQQSTMATVDNSAYQDASIRPVYVALSETASDTTGETSIYLRVWPYVNTQGTLYVQHWTPPAELAIDGTDDSTPVSAPDRVVFEFALMMALNERGEEIGEPGNVAERRYVDALTKAIEDDIDFSQRTNKFDWRRD